MPQSSRKLKQRRHSKIGAAGMRSRIDSASSINLQNESATPVSVSKKKKIKKKKTMSRKR